MARSLSPRAIVSGNDPTTSDVWLVLLTMTHPDFAAPIRVVNNNENVVSRGSVYQFFPFDIELPGEDVDSPSRARLRIDNVDREIVRAIRSIASPPAITLEVILAATPDLIEVAYSGLVLREVEYDAASVSGELVFESIFTEPVTYTMTPSRFPGVF